MRSLPFVRARLLLQGLSEIVKLSVSAGLDSASDRGGLDELGSTHDMSVLEVDVAPSVKRLSGRVFAPEVEVRALGKGNSKLSSTGFASAE